MVMPTTTETEHQQWRSYIHFIHIISIILVHIISNTFFFPYPFVVTWLHTIKFQIIMNSGASVLYMEIRVKAPV